MPWAAAPSTWSAVDELVDVIVGPMLTLNTATGGATNSVKGCVWVGHLGNGCFVGLASGFAGDRPIDSSNSAGVSAWLSTGTATGSRTCGLRIGEHGGVGGRAGGNADS